MCGSFVMKKNFAIIAAVLASAIALGLKLMARSLPPSPVLARLQRCSHTSSPNTCSQSRVSLPDHVLGHPCLYYPNFISNDVAAQVKLATASAPVSANTPLHFF